MMRCRFLLLSGTMLACSLPGAVRAQEGDAPSGEPVNEIVVQAERLAGQLNVEQAPVLELNAEDIEAVGATSVADLIAAIAPQTGSARGRGGGGRPVFLVNGIRIGSFRELRSYPPEAIAKVEVLPEEVAQRFGFPPDRRVVNLILKQDYSSREIELEFEGPDRGDYIALEQEFTLLRIADGARLNFNAEARDISLLTEAERGIIQTEGSQPSLPGDPDPAEFRSLVPDSLDIEVTANWAKALLESGTSLSLNATYQRFEERSLSGLNSVLLVGPGPDGDEALRTFGADDPLERQVTSDTFSTAASVNRPIGSFQLTGTFDASYSNTSTRIDRLADTQDLIDAAAAGTLALDAALPQSADNGFDLAERATYLADGKLTLAGTPLFLPGGELGTTFDLGYKWNRIESADTRSGTDVALTRGNLEGGINIVVPITSRREGFADAIGSISLSGQAGFNHLSDFGTLFDWTVGLNWSPWDNLDLQATYIWREVQPSLSELGNPQIETLNVPTFDFAAGETVLATITSGGNPALVAETQSDWKFSANWELPFWDNTRLSAEYIRNTSNDVTSGFPVLTSEIEAAFPERVERDMSDRLLAIDRRPITLAETRTERLVFGLTTRGNFGEARPSEGGRQGGRESMRAGPAGDGESARLRRGPPTEAQRARFMQFREQLCADDGLQVLERLVDAVESGEDLSAQFPDFDPERAARMLERLRDDDGTIDRSRLAGFRDRICSFDPAMMRGGARGENAGSGQNPAQTSGRGGGGARAARIPGFGGRNGRGRYFANITHTINVSSEVLVAPGGPVLDLLGGDALESDGLVRHATRLEAGMFRNGWGVRLSGRYTGKTRIEGSGLPGSTDLFFGDLATIDLRLFANLGRILENEDGFLKNLRVAFRADNVFDARRRVTDSNGDVPLRYQPFLIDPTGRFVGVDLRKLF